MELKYKVIDVKKWERRDAYIYFTKMNPAIYAATAEVDVTEAVMYRKKTGTGFFPLCLWLVCRVVNEMSECRYGYKDGKQLIQYNHIIPSFPVFHGDTQSCTIVCADTCQKFSDFVSEYTEQVELAEKNRKFLTSKFKTPPANVFSITMVPTLYFTGSSFIYSPSSNPPVLYPIVTLGKCDFRDGRYCMPMTFQINHAAADGLSSGVFFDKVQQVFSDPDKYLNDDFPESLESDQSFQECF